MVFSLKRLQKNIKYTNSITLLQDELQLRTAFSKDSGMEKYHNNRQSHRDITKADQHNWQIQVSKITKLFYQKH